MSKAYASAWVSGRNWLKLSYAERTLFGAMRAFSSNAPEGALLELWPGDPPRVGAVVLLGGPTGKQHQRLSQRDSDAILHSIVQADVVLIDGR